MSWYLQVLKKYTDFNGRARRKEYWFFVLFYFIIYTILTIVDIVIGVYNTESSIGILSGVYILALIIPFYAVMIRRLHDTGKSGWWSLLGIIPLINLILLIFFVQDSQTGENQYGPNPKY